MNDLTVFACENIYEESLIKYIGQTTFFDLLRQMHETFM